MRNWLIRALGGCTPETFQKTLQEVAQIQAARDNEVHWLRLAIENSQKREEHLQEVIFKRFGITLPEVQSQQTQNPTPIDMSRGGWGKQKQRLENADLKRHLDNLTEQYKGRSTPMPPGDSPSSNSSEHILERTEMGD